jgi:hypothetical protein
VGAVGAEKFQEEVGEAMCLQLHSWNYKKSLNQVCVRKLMVIFLTLDQKQQRI